MAQNALAKQVTGLHVLVLSHHASQVSIFLESSRTLRTKEIQMLKQVLAEWEKGDAGEFPTKPAPEVSDADNGVDEEEEGKVKEGFETHEEGPPPSYYSEEEILADDDKVQGNDKVADDDQVKGNDKVGWLQAPAL